MSEPRTRWNELLDLPNEVKDPDLYQLLGLDRLAFDAAKVEPEFRARMAKLQATRSTKHKEFIEFAKGELRRALRVLEDEDARRAYDDELALARARAFRRLLVPVLACGAFPPAAEKAVLAAAREIGLAEDEARALLDEARGVSRGDRSDRASRRWGTPPSESERLKLVAQGKKSRAERKGKHGRSSSGSKRALARALASAAADSKKTCTHCRREIPANWRTLGAAERLGTRLLCPVCVAAIRANEACASCSETLGPLDGTVSPLGEGRVCEACVKGLVVCAGCEVLLPPILFERGEAAERGGRRYCKECLATRG